VVGLKEIKMNGFIIRNRENGCWLTECSTYDEAYQQLLEWELEDKEDGSYIENFYTISDLEDNLLY
jgi:hypothetical protein